MGNLTGLFGQHSARAERALSKDDEGVRWRRRRILLTTTCAAAAAAMTVMISMWTGVRISSYSLTDDTIVVSSISTSNVRSSKWGAGELPHAEIEDDAASTSPREDDKWPWSEENETLVDDQVLKYPIAIGESKSTTQRSWVLLVDEPTSGITELTNSVFYHELRPSKFNTLRTKMTKKFPQITFIKGLKVGGTSVSVALDGAARAYGVKLQEGIDPAAARKGKISPIGVSPNGKHCNHDAGLFFHHAKRSRWMTSCMFRVRFVTLLREPIAQTLSWESMSINREYFINYPERNCTIVETERALNGGRGTAKQRLEAIRSCLANSVRRNLTMQIVARRISGWPSTYPTGAVNVTQGWIADRAKLDSPSAIIDLLKHRYFLVGVTERLNEFLLVIALHMGWDPSTLYYRKCKPTDITISPEDLRLQFPDLYDKLRRSTMVMRAGYEWARDEFDRNIRRLNELAEGRVGKGWFTELLARFETGLKLYQKNQHYRSSGAKSYKWRTYTYKDGTSSEC